MDLNDSITLIRDLLSPTKANEISFTPNQTISSILQGTLDNFKALHVDYYQSLNLNDQNDIIWMVCRICLSLIGELNNAKFETNESQCYLSMNDDQLVFRLCEFVVCFGIHYNLADNIGMPIERLSKYGFMLKAARPNTTAQQKTERLLVVLAELNVLRSCIRVHVNFINILYKKYLHDLICALVQVCYSPSHQSSGNLDFVKWLEVDLYADIDAVVLVRSLIMVQGANNSLCPKWFLMKTGDLLTACVLQPNSVMTVIKAILNDINGGIARSNADDWKKCDLIAHILSKCPRSMHIDNYFKFISPQILRLISNENQNISTKYLARVIGSIYAKFANKWPDLTRVHLTDPLLHPLNSHSAEINLNSKDLNRILNSVNLIFVSCAEPNWNALKQLDRSAFMHLVFQVYVFTQAKITCKAVHKQCEDLIKLYLNMTDEPIGFLGDLLACSIVIDNQECHYCRSNETVRIEDPFETDSVCLLLVHDDATDDEQLTIETVNKRCESISNLIQHDKYNDIQINFLFYLFEKLNGSMDAELTKRGQTCTTDRQPLLDIENSLKYVENSINSKILFATQLSYLFETMNPDVLLTNYEKIIELCNLLLATLSGPVGDSSQQTSMNVDTSEPNDVLFLVLSIVTVFTSDMLGEIGYDVKKKLHILLPNLKKLKELHGQSASLGGLLDELIVSVSTYCAVKTEVKAAAATAATGAKRKPLIEEVDTDAHVVTYAKALKEIGDPLVPVRGHGLVLLRKLIECNDAECLANIDQVFDILLNNIRHDDSYIYQAAISAMIAALAFWQKTDAFKILLGEYIHSKRLDADGRLKIGEVLAKHVRNLADLVPFHGDVLLGIFLGGCKSDDEFIRTSSFSNLGETCKLMKFSIKSHINEIIQCISSAIDTDKSINVKRSAVLTLKLLFEGLKNENFLAILDDSILGLYRILKKCLNKTDDAVFTTHAQLAYQYLDELMKNFLFPRQNLVKEIRILNI